MTDRFVKNLMALRELEKEDEGQLRKAEEYTVDFKDLGSYSASRFAHPADGMLNPEQLDEEDSFALHLMGNQTKDAKALHAFIPARLSKFSVN